MSKRSLVITAAILVTFLGGYVVSNRQAPLEGQGEEGADNPFAAVAGNIGSLDAA